MNLFWKKLFGKLNSTAKFEAELQQRHDDFLRYERVKASAELSEYNRLFDIVSSPEFKEKKKLLVSRKYKDTIEFRDKNKFNKLQNKSSLQQYLQILQSHELKEYLNFKASEDFHLLSKAEEVKKSPVLSALKKFEKSNDYKIYMRFHDSYILKEYEELKATVSTDEFKKNDAFWSNPDRWNLTEESKTEKRYRELADNEEIKFYLAHKEEEFADYYACRVLFEDDFNGNTLDKEKWETGFYQKSADLKKDYSFIDEQQAYNMGKNVTIDNSLTIRTKAEKTEATVWHQKKGFITKEFDYTSDVIHVRNLKLQNNDTVMAKVKFNGAEGVNHAIRMVGENRLPVIDLCRKNNGTLEMGIYQKQLNNVVCKSTKITGLNTEDYFVYSIKFENNNIMWYINNLEVFRYAVSVNDNLTIHMQSFIPEKNNGGKSSMVVDYIKIYRQN